MQEVGQGLTLVFGGSVLLDPGQPPQDADLLIRAGEIVEVGPALQVGEGAARISAADRIIIPGLINSHTHSQGNLAKAHGDRWTLELLLNNGSWMSGNRTSEEKYLSALLGAAEMIRRGCTACYDLFAEIPHVTGEGLNAVGQAYTDAGMRAVVAPMLSDITFYQAVTGLIEAMDPPDAERARRMRLLQPAEIVEICREALKHWPFDPEQVRLDLAPTIPLLCSDAVLAQCRELTAEYGVGFHTHMAESRVWANLGQAKYGCSLTRHFDKFKILGPRFTAAHAVWMNDDDLALMGERGASIAHNPLSNMRLGSGLADVPSMRRRGVNVGLGTDSCNCSDNLSMFESMRIASYTSRVLGYGVEDWLRSEDVIRMATEGSAKALGWGGKLGAIEAGRKADVVFLDRRDVAFVPLHNFANQLVNCADSTAVAAVMVNGRMIYEDRKFLTFDYDALVARAEQAAERLWVANRDTRQWQLHLEPLVNSVCSGIAPPFRRSGLLTPAEPSAARS
jgi:5-methylthioadenosine/S-adenosylhomocysteine deaminase